MSKFEDPRLRELCEIATATGEIVAVTGDTVTIRGDFSPGLDVALHPGARVSLYTDDDLLDIPDRADGELL